MNKPIAPNKFVTDTWSMVQMLIEEAVLAEREACAKACDALHEQTLNLNVWAEITAETCAYAIRARGQA